MLETGDIRVEYNHDSMPYPGQEPPDFFKGQPIFRGRYDDMTRLNVGGTYQDIIRVKGERDMTMKFQEQDFTNTNIWHTLETWKLHEGVAGFKLSFTVQNKHYAGIHHLRYIASNAKGAAHLMRNLQINQRTTGG
ncbi:hypothetical protein BSL78_06967 [Apostichopus japonicus]|uniref:Uncharacterized protein n=1 Tax=Stichopus japonicus TaxID=307972 RepID=A0A2G8L726_STIJA|nr:hypothetical protein BSL78_06967 [Apostichopus japonicus]